MRVAGFVLYWWPVGWVRTRRKLGAFAARRLAVSGSIGPYPSS